MASSFAALANDTEYYTSTAARYVDSGVTKNLSSLIRKIEAGDANSWTEFRDYLFWPYLDGEHSQAYSVACAELSRRDPTFFLRMYLRGDKMALTCAQRAYGYSGVEGRAIMDKILARRLYIADERSEKATIKRFIREISNQQNE